MTPTRILICGALMWLIVGIVLMCQHAFNFAAVSGIMGTLMGIIAFCSALRDAGYFKGIHHTPAE
jgi:F0F1-type ATP synthase assembly protein I